MRSEFTSLSAERGSAVSGQMPRVRSLHVASRFGEEMGGSIRAALNVCKALARVGDGPECLGTIGAHDRVGYLSTDYAEIPVHLFPRTFPMHYSRSPRAWKWLLDNVARFDIVDIHGVFSFPPMYAALAAKRLGVPYVIRPHGSLEPYDLRKHSIQKQIFAKVLLRRVIEGAAAVILTSELESRRLSSFGAYARKVVVPLPVPETGRPHGGPEFRVRHGLSPNAVVVLFLGRIDEKKGLDVLISATGRLRAAGRDVQLLIVGAADARENRFVQGLISRQPDNSWIVSAGFLSGAEKLAALDASDIFALPSQNENFGIAVVEAMQSAIPVVLSEEVYICDEVVKGGAGVSCAPDVTSCLKALDELASSLDRRSEMGAAARRVASDMYGEAGSTRSLQSIYQQIVQGNIVPASSARGAR